MAYLPIHLVDFYGFHVGKYTDRPMDPMGYAETASGNTRCKGREGRDQEEPCSRLRTSVDPSDKTQR